MKIIHLSVLALASWALISCKQKPQTILIAGDSWGFAVCTYKSLEKSLETEGIKDVGTNSTCPVTTRVGMRASRWLDSAFHTSTRVALMDASVKVLYLSLGGNDIMNSWNKNMSPAQETEAFENIKNTLAEIISIYQQARPDIKILVSGYDYPRFIANHPVAEYKEAYEFMGSPTPPEMNKALVRFTEVMAGLADQKKVFYIHHLGLMHYYYGNQEAGLAALSTLAPELISSPDDVLRFGGDLRYQTDPKGMAKLGETEGAIIDAFHLSKSGFQKLADHTVMHYLKGWFSKKNSAPKNVSF